MNLTTASIDLNDDQTRTRSTDMNQFTVRGGKFSYKSIKPITSIILNGYSVLFLNGAKLQVYSIVVL